MRSVDDVHREVAQLDGSADLATAAHDPAHEAAELTLDSEKAQSQLGWRNLLSFEESIGWTVAWSQRRAGGETALGLTSAQIAQFGRLSA